MTPEYANFAVKSRHLPQVSPTPKCTGTCCTPSEVCRVVCEGGDAPAERLAYRDSLRRHEEFTHRPGTMADALRQHAPGENASFYTGDREDGREDNTDPFDPVEGEDEDDEPGDEGGFVSVWPDTREWLLEEADTNVSL